MQEYRRAILEVLGVGAARNDVQEVKNSNRLWNKTKARESASVEFW
jgi:hypothetical protein